MVFDIEYQLSNKTCSLCGKPIEHIYNLFRVPIFDPSKVEYPQELVPHINRLVHRCCWEEWSNYELVCSLVIENLEDEFRSSFCLVRGEQITAWVRICGDPNFSPGTIFLPRTSLMFSNLLGIDVKSGVFRARSKSIQCLIYALLENKIHVASGQKKEKTYVKITYGEVIKNILKVEIISSDKVLNGIYFIYKPDLELLRNSLTIPLEKLI
jgi:hypothetical protein